MKANLIITTHKFTDVDGVVFDKNIKLVNIEVSEEFFDDVNILLKDKQVTAYFEKGETILK